MGKYEASNTDLTKNQKLVMGALSNANGPLSAYTILDELREHGFRAPLQVYRALEKLVELGLVHRLESACSRERTVVVIVEFAGICKVMQRAVCCDRD